MTAQSTQAPRSRWRAALLIFGMALLPFLLAGLATAIGASLGWSQLGRLVLALYLAALVVFVVRRADCWMWATFLSGTIAHTLLWRGADDAGMPLRYGYVVDLDRAIAGGVLPTHWLQSHMPLDSLVDPLLIFTLLAAFLDVPERGRLVVWDDSCSFCRRWVAAFRRLDAFGALRFVGASSPAAYDGTGVTPHAAAEAMQLVHPDGRVHSGYDAVRAILAVLPLTFLIAPYLALPGIRHLGHAAYRRTAARRTCRYESHAAPVGKLTEP